MKTCPKCKAWNYDGTGICCNCNFSLPAERSAAGAHSLHRLVSLPLRDIAAEMDAMMETLDKHHRLAAEVRCLLHNGGAGPNLSQLKRCDVMLREIAGLPAEHQNDE